jgi:hypothetical protein
MTDVVEAGRPDGPRRRLPRLPRSTALPVAGLAVAVALAGTAFLLGRGGGPPIRPAASPTRTTIDFGSTATGPDLTADPTGEPVPDPFTAVVVLPLPPAGGARPVTLNGGEPGFLVDDGTPVAVSAVVHVPGAPVVVAWCPATRTFEDPSGAYRFDARGRAYDLTTSATRYAVRAHDAARVEVGAGGEELGGTEVAAGTPPPRCAPDALVRAPLPPFAGSLTRLGRGWRRVHGSLRVEHGRGSLCRTVRRSGCVEPFRDVPDTVLLPWDLAGRVTYDGDFLVVDATPDLYVARLPGTTEVAERVGSTLRIGYVSAVPGRVVRFDAWRHYTGTPGDDSPGPRRAEPEDLGGLATNERDGTRDYRVRPDVEVHLAGTADGSPAEATLDDLRRKVAQATHPGVLVWLALDARGRVLRVIEQPAQF